MSLLTRAARDTTAGDAPPPGRVPLHSPVALGALAALQAVGGSLLCIICPLMGVWIASTRTGATWNEALRISGDAWLLAHHTGIAVAGGHVGLVPLGLSAVPAAWCWAAGRRMATALGLASPVFSSGRNGKRAWAMFTGVYALLALLVSLLAASPVARPVSGQALLGGLVLGGAVAGTAMLRASRTTAHPSAAAAVAARLHLPALVRQVLPAAAVALAIWTAAASLALAATLVLRWDDVVAVHRALAPGPVGGLVLAVAELTVVPVAVVWAGAVLAGPGFAVGAGTSVTPAAAQLGAVPAVPLLGALPSGPMPAWAVVLPAVPVLAGVAAALLLHRRAGAAAGSWQSAVGRALLCGGLCGAGAALLAALASGPVGPGRMATIGPDPVAVGLAIAAEVAGGCLVALLLLGRFAAQPAVDGAAPAGAGAGPTSMLRSWVRSRTARS